MKKQKIILKILVSLLVLVIAALIIFVMIIYSGIKKSVDETTENADRIETRRSIDLSTGSSFNILLLGIDTGEEGRIDQGRSDTMLLATVNGTGKRSLLMSLPRDTYTEIVGENRLDKMNHAYAFGGSGMSMDTVQSLLDVPVDHYISINMKGIQEIVDFIGGVEVVNETEFTYQDSVFHRGKIRLNGTDALKYTRMRYEDPEGDYGRQRRQRLLIKSMITKIIGVKNLKVYQNLLQTLEDNLRTDLTFDDMQKLILHYNKALKNVSTNQLHGTSFMKNEISYQKVENRELKRCHDLILDYSKKNSSQERNYSK